MTTETILRPGEFEREFPKVSDPDYKAGYFIDGAATSFAVNV